ncbi:MAG: hypothetical protein U0U46_12360 [Saprospiraceae bacterium]
MLKITTKLLILIAAVALSGCSTQVKEHSNKNELLQNAGVADNPTAGQTELADLYTLAIAEYIGEAKQTGKTGFGTLYVGIPSESPDVDLPATISGVQIRKVNETEVEAKKSAYTQASPFINLIGMVEHGNAEFIFVTFYPEFEHQFDCYLNYEYNTQTKKFDLLQSRIEVLVRNAEGGADHFAVYKQGRHTGDRPIPENQK